MVLLNGLPCRDCPSQAPQKAGGPCVWHPYRVPACPARVDGLLHLRSTTHRFPLRLHPQPRIGACVSRCGAGGPEMW